MSSIGPEIPPHLRQQLDEPSEDSIQIGPQVPPGVLQPQTTITDNDDDDDDYVPELPPDLAAARSVSLPDSVTVEPKPSTSKPVAGPSIPSHLRAYNPTPQNHSVYEEDDDDDDDVVGPRPPPAGMKRAETNAVQEFLEREERRRKALEESSAPKPLKRDEWMLVPPSSSDLLGNIDPTKLKARQFSRSTAPAAKKVDNSLWTETPAERQQRLADEVSGKKRRVTDVSVDQETGDEKRRRREEESIRKGVDVYTQKVRGPSLLTQHAGSGKAEPSAADEGGGIWDHSRDMSLGGRLMDDSKRTKLIREAQGLGDRFGTGKSGGFL